jgi:hypothetical protein
VGNNTAAGLLGLTGSPLFFMKSKLPQFRTLRVWIKVPKLSSGLLAKEMWVLSMHHILERQSNDGAYSMTTYNVAEIEDSRTPDGQSIYATSRISDPELEKLIADEIDAMAGKAIVQRVTIDRNPEPCAFHEAYRAWLNSLASPLFTEPKKRARRMRRRRSITY